MKKLIITGTFGAMLCLSTGAPADASIVSRGFLDEALTNYATTTALDLKANQQEIHPTQPLAGVKINYNDLDKINPDNAVYRSYISWRDWFQMNYYG